MRKALFATFLLALSSASILSAAVEKPYVVRDLTAADNQPRFILVTPRGSTQPVEFTAHLKGASGNQLVPFGIQEWFGSDETILNPNPGQSWGFSLVEKPAGLYKLELGNPINQKIWGILDGYVPPQEAGDGGIPGVTKLFGTLLVGPAEVISLTPQDFGHVVIYLGKVAAQYGGSEITYLVYQKQGDGWHAWAVPGEKGAYPEATCASAVTLTLPATPGDGYQPNRTGFVEIIDNASGESFPQVLLIPDGIAASFPVVCQ